MKLLRKTACLSMLFALSTTLNTTDVAADVLKATVISARDNLRIEDWYRDSHSVKLPPQPNGLFEKRPCTAGNKTGVDFIEVDNGRLRFSVIPTRGMSVYEVVKGDLRLGWNSPVKEIVHPAHVNLQSRGGLGWLAGFNEWMVRCGLESAGHPGQDKFINNVGDEATMDLTLHGKIGNIPASEVQILIEKTAPYRIRIRGRVDERMFYGPQLELWTEISTEIGSNSFTIQDSLTNRGGSEQEFQIIYHGNFGPPLLGEDAELVAPIQSVSPFNDHAAQSLEHHAIYGPPTHGFIEQVYCIRPYADGVRQDDRDAQECRQQPRCDNDLLPPRSPLPHSMEKRRGSEVGLCNRNRTGHRVSL